MKNKKNSFGIVYSTNPDFKIEEDNQHTIVTPNPKDQKLTIKLETKHRAGKTVTIIDGFIGNEADREELVKKLKNFCGTGGSAKDDEMLIQGDQREKVMQWLIKNGFTQSKKKN